MPEHHPPAIVVREQGSGAEVRRIPVPGNPTAAFVQHVTNGITNAMRPSEAQLYFVDDSEFHYLYEPREEAPAP